MEIATGRTIVYKLIKFVSPICIRQELDRFGQHEEKSFPRRRNLARLPSQISGYGNIAESWQQRRNFWWEE